MINAYNFYRRLKNMAPITITPEEYKLSIGFLISSGPVHGLYNTDPITKDGYAKIKNMIDDYLNSKSGNRASLISYITTDNPDTIKLNNWNRHLVVPNDAERQFQKDV